MGIDGDVEQRVFRAMRLGASFATVLTDRDLVIEWASESVFDTIGVTPAELVGCSAVTLLHPDDLPRIGALIAAQLERPTAYAIGGDPARRALNNARLRRADGTYVNCEFAATNLSEDESVRGYFLYLRVADDRRYLELAYERMASGAAANEVVDAVRSMLASQFEPSAIDISLDRATVAMHVDEPRSWRFIVADSAGDPVASIDINHEGAIDEPTLWAHHVVESASRILQILANRETLMSQLQAAAITDSLTGLRNRRGFMDALSAVTASDDPDLSTAVLYLDVDNFKALNDAHGHMVGDAILAAIGARLVSRVRDSDVVGRLGGDEFAILCHDVLPRAVRSLSQRLLDGFLTPIFVEGIAVEVSLSIGIATSSTGDWRYLLNSADVALLQAKADGKRTSAWSS